MRSSAVVGVKKFRIIRKFCFVSAQKGGEGELSQRGILQTRR